MPAEPERIDEHTRYEVLPFHRGLHQATELAHPVHLTVTCSPKHGPDHALEAAARLRELGNEVTVHVAANLVRDAAHADALLRRMTELGIADLFLIGGDAAQAVGDYATAGELLKVVAAHPLRPASLGIAGYPEGHPFIDDATLDEALLNKAALADYVTTQLCFDPAALERWLARQRGRGLDLPVWLGMPGQVSAARLLEISAHIGVGPSVSFLRKQRGPRGLFGMLTARHGTVTERLFDKLGPIAGADGRVQGLHYFTLNELIATREWHLARDTSAIPFAEAAPAPSPPARSQEPESFQRAAS
jgi:methylenetetrahydrofolate reductase (NADPH)